jgi:hypothetical protein
MEFGLPPASLSDDHLLRPVEPLSDHCALMYNLIEIPGTTEKTHIKQSIPESDQENRPMKV